MIEQTIHLSGKGIARGRNGGFKAATVQISAMNGHVWLVVRSKRHGKSPPIMLRLNIMEALQVGDVLIDYGAHMSFKEDPGDSQ